MDNDHWPVTAGVIAVALILLMLVGPSCSFTIKIDSRPSVSDGGEAGR